MGTLDRTTGDETLAGRITFIGAALALLMLGGWCSWFYPFDDWIDRSGTPLGADFAMFYVGGQVVVDGEADRLYDQAEHQRRLHELFPAVDSQYALPYRYPPFVAWLMAPLASLPHALAFAIFITLSSSAWLAALACMWRELPMLREHWRAPICWALLGWPVALETLIGGQASMFGLLILVVAYQLLRAQRYAAAGAVLALAAYKPNLLFFVVLGCAIRYPRMLRGLVPVGAGLLLLSLLPAGWHGLWDYYQLSTSLASQPWDVATPFWKVHGLAAWFSLWIPAHGRLTCIVIGVALTLLLTIASHRVNSDRERNMPLWFAGLAVINFLFNPYVPIYDLVLLVVPTLLVAEYAAARFGPHIDRQLLGIQIALAALYFGPHLSQAVAKTTGVQLFALAAIIAVAWQLRPRTRAHETPVHVSA